MTDAGGRLDKARKTWHGKGALRAVYNDLFRRMAAACRQGTTLEVGAGTGNLKDYMPDVISIDLEAAPWLDAVADGAQLPFHDAAFDNLLALDVLHHVSNVPGFFSEAARVLRPGGRLVIVEPAITPVSGIFYQHFHPEPFDLTADPLRVPAEDRRPGPEDANQAVSVILFRRNRAAFEAAFPQFHVRALTWLSLFAYPLSGGFRSWCLIPAWCVGPVLRIEDLVLPIIGGLMAFRMMVVMERTGAETPA